MMLPIRDDHPIRDLFSGLLENTFYSQVGLCEPKLTDYLSELMIEFMHVDRFKQLRNAFGRDLEQIARVLLMLHGQDPSAKPRRDLDRDMYRLIGDYALFWSGIFPEYLRSRRRGGDLLKNYVRQGKRSYATAARLTHDQEEPPPDLLKSLSEEFETCVHGLGLVRRCWEERRGEEPGSGHILC